MDDLIAALNNVLPPDSVLIGVAARARTAAGSTARVLVLPRTTEQVSQVLALCHRARRSVVPQGGLTGLVQGAVSGADEVAMSLERMRQVEKVDAVNRTITAQAGAPLQAVQEAAAAVGMMLPLDLGARSTATIGGNVATNAGGTRVLRFGMMRDMVLGLEAVLADGTVVDARSKILKNNTGYDIKQLFIGAEGTLGIVTSVVLRLRPLLRSRSTAMLAIDRFDQVVRLLSIMEARLLGTLSSFEVMWRSFYDLVATARGAERCVVPRGHGFYVLVETLGTDQARDDEALVAALDAAHAQELFTHAEVAQTPAARAELWSLRENLDQLAREGPVFAYDVSLPLSAMEAYVDELDRELSVRFAHHRLYVFGHIADGNLHLAIRVNDHDAHEVVDDIVYGALSPDDSSVSAEHGIGLLKKRHLGLSRSAAELAVMRALKQALDPRGILNPGKIFDLTGT